MFDRIAHRYDLLNHLLSGNRDFAWRRGVAELLPDKDCQTVLDLATGTGDQLLALYESGKVKTGIGLDLAEKMLELGRQKISGRGLTPQLELRQGDAEAIPFETGTFDAVTMSFGIRNVIDVEDTLREILRVLVPGGRALILEFSLPCNRLIRKLYLFYLRHVLPVLGGLISGERGAYRYLNQTIESFPSGEDFCSLMLRAGYSRVEFKPLTLGIASIYLGEKP